MHTVHTIITHTPPSQEGNEECVWRPINHERADLPPCINQIAVVYALRSKCLRYCFEMPQHHYRHCLSSTEWLQVTCSSLSWSLITIWVCFYDTRSFLPYLLLPFLNSLGTLTTAFCLHPLSNNLFFLPLSLSSLHTPCHTFLNTFYKPSTCLYSFFPSIIYFSICHVLPPLPPFFPTPCHPFLHF